MPSSWDAVELASRVRLVGFGESSLDVEIDCNVLIHDLQQFLAVREELYLGIMDLIARAGTGLASPTRTGYKLPGSAVQQKIPDPNTVTMRRRG